MAMKRLKRRKRSSRRDQKKRNKLRRKLRKQGLSEDEIFMAVPVPVVDFEEEESDE